MILQAAYIVGVCRQENQTILLLPRLLATMLENLCCLGYRLALPALAVGSIGRQYHQAQGPVIRHIRAVGEHMHTTKTASNVAQALTDSREYILTVFEAFLTLFHLAAQVRSSIEPKVIVACVQVMQLVGETTQGILVQPNLLFRLRTTQQNPLQLNSPYHLVCSSRCTPQEDGTRRTPTGLHSTKACVLIFDLDSFRSRAIDIPIHHRIPASRQVIGKFVTRVGITERQAACHDQWVVVTVLPQAVDDLGHHLEHATSALEIFQARPIVIQAIKHFGVNRIGLLQTLIIMTLLGFGRKVGSVGNVKIGKLAAHLLRRQLIIDTIEQPAPHDLEGFLGSHRLPQRLHTAEVM